MNHVLPGTLMEKKKFIVRFLCEKGAYNVVGQLSSIILRTDDGAFERKK